MSKLERLLKLLAALLNTTRPLSAEDLRRQIGGYPDNDASFRRTFERDKDDLRTLVGVAISVESVPGTEPPLDGYIVHQEDYVGQDPGLEPDELAALHLAAASVRVDNLGDDPFWKLGGAVESTQAGGVVASMPAADLAGEFQTAVAERRIARFAYSDVERALEPSRISFSRGFWYVSGHDQTREASRSFRLDRIVGPVSLGPPKAYEPKPARGPETVRTWEFGEGDPIEAVVTIDANPDTAALLTTHLREEEVVQRSDGSIEVHVQVRNQDAFLDWVLSFSDAAVIQSPNEFRTALVDRLDLVVEAHS